MRLEDILFSQGFGTRRVCAGLIQQGHVTVQGQLQTDAGALYDPQELPFSVQGEAWTWHDKAYLMLHKPAGCVSATHDPQHPTVLELLPAALRADLHIAGRLDFNTTGLMILTNDGQWSRRLTQPATKLPKQYLVETEDEIAEHYVAKFREGFYFAFENLTTQPAQLDILGPRQARLAIVEGRYHQVKRMFGFFDNKVVGLHRESMGAIRLDPGLAPGAFRQLTPEEIGTV